MVYDRYVCMPACLLITLQVFIAIGQRFKPKDKKDILQMACWLIDGWKLPVSAHRRAASMLLTLLYTLSFQCQTKMAPQESCDFLYPSENAL